MTANTSPRLGLMLPQNSDSFSPDDYVTSFTKLDNTPGVTLVPNFAGLPSNLTSAQHGSPYMQLDNGAEWYWYQPSAGTPGSWKRRNNLGILGQATQAASSIGTTTTVAASGPTLCTISIPNMPGGRWLNLMVEFSGGNSNGISVCTLWVNSAIYKEISNYGNSGNHFLSYWDIPYPPVTAGSTLVVKMSLRCAVIPASLGGFGTSTCVRPTSITVKEV